MASMPEAMRIATAALASSDASEHDAETPSQSASQQPPQPQPSATKRKYSHTTEEQTQRMLEWLELPGNFQLLTRPATSLSEGASPPHKRVKKMDGYRSLAQYMNLKTQSQWSDKMARSRYESFMAGFRKAKKQTPHYLKPAYRRVDELFQTGGRPRRASVGNRVESIITTERDWDDRGFRSTASSPGVEVSARSGSIGSRMESIMAALVTESKRDSPTLPVLEPPGFGSRELTVLEPPPRYSRVEETSRELVVSEQAAPTPEPTRAVRSEQVATPPREQRTSYGSATSTPKSDIGAGESVTVAASSPTETLNEQAIRLESQRLAVRQQELALKQNELVSKQQQSRQTLRAEVLTRLVEAGKSPAEVREYLKIMDAE